MAINNISHVFFKLCKWTDRQTDTDSSKYNLPCSISNIISWAYTVVAQALLLWP